LTSHDLRAPVVNINSLLNFYNKENPLDKDNPIIIEKIEDSVLRLQSTLNDLVDIVALKKKEVEIKENVSFSNTTDEVKATIQSLIHRVDPIIEVDFKVKNIKYPKTHLTSIVQNLMTNAIKYRSPKKRLKIEIKSYNHQEYVCLEISDNGLGINMKKYGDKLFGIYQRFHNVPNSKGLGLYIVKTQVEMMGGYIEVSSKVNHGTTFSIFLLRK
jgi:signal transduction histidine kinase